MNYGYAGTRELNEALVSRFLVIDMPMQNEETLGYLMDIHVSGNEERGEEGFCGSVSGSAEKSGAGGDFHEGAGSERTDRALRTVRAGLSPWQAVKMGIVNKCFDIYEREIVQDAAMTRIPLDWSKGDVF